MIPSELIYKINRVLDYKNTIVYRKKPNDPSTDSAEIYVIFDDRQIRVINTPATIEVRRGQFAQRMMGFLKSDFDPLWHRLSILADHPEDRDDFFENVFGDIR